MSVFGHFSRSDMCQISSTFDGHQETHKTEEIKDYKMNYKN